MIDNAKGFTRAGVGRINDSIRTYCWAILGSCHKQEWSSLDPALHLMLKNSF